MSQSSALLLDLGRLPYNEAWDKQLEVAEMVMAGAPDTLIFVEHPPVLTLGAGFHEQNLLFTPEQLKQKGVDVVRTDRGGDVTYHCPGQLVIYPIFDLTRHGKDLHKWLRDLEETQLAVLAHYGIEGRRFPPHTGAWIGDKKVSAIGVKIKKWVSVHGIAMNCNNAMDGFQLIIPCGIVGYGVTSLSMILGRDVTVDEVKAVTIQAFEQVFDLQFGVV
ncbi:MAG: lipoyl(octanoyl) transferase LipB [Armatimonadetes bacterium]|nr:lipoyl(octanoyl) transferase LipB [Armatimonadota bacterium]